MAKEELTTDEWKVEVGTRLRLARIEAGLEQKDVADLLECTPQLISAQEQGKSEIKGSQLKVLCPLYGKSPDYLLFNVRVVPVTGGNAPGGVLADILGRAGAADPAGR